MVEQRFCKARVGGSNPLLGSSIMDGFAGIPERPKGMRCRRIGFTPTEVRILLPAPAEIAQSVEHIHGKNEVRGSIPRLGSR